MSDSRSCGRCIYYNSITNECGEESKCQRDVDEAKYTSYIEGKKQGKVDGAREFAEWLCRKSDYTDIDINGFMTCRCGDSPRDTTIEQALAEWQKGE